MSTQRLFDSLWGESGYCSLLVGPGYSEAAAQRAIEALEDVSQGPLLQSEVVRATWLVPMVQIINLALLREFPGRNSSSVIAKEIVEILGISSDDLDEGSQDDGFRVKVARLMIHWDLDKGFLGILRRHDFSKSALKAFLTDLDEWAGLHKEFAEFPKAFVSELWHVPEYVLRNGPRELNARYELQRLIVPKIANIFGEPVIGAVDSYLSNPNDFENERC